MYQSTDSEDDSAPEQPHQEATEPTRDQYAFLREARRNDMREGYHEEKDLFSGRGKRRHEADCRLSDSDEEDVDVVSVSEPKRQKNAAERMMEKMGYKDGQGLGKKSQGITEPVALSNQRGKIGLGHEANKVISRDFGEVWDESKETKTVEEQVEWMSRCEDSRRKNVCQLLRDDRAMMIRKKKMKIEDETQFCNADILNEMLEAKKVFDNLSERDLREARTRANPYETIGSSFFQNRAAMKTANLDRIYDWLFSQERDDLQKKNPLQNNATPHNTDREEELFYFADVCAGPGGFSEYMLWRKGFYNAKGFGFTLVGKNDFKLNKFCASSAFYFEPFYGVKNDGDVMNPDNIDSLEKFVMSGTNNTGVHLMMADGGFSVEGNENLQEILSKRLYLCQLLVSLCIVRDGGNFFCKLFDVFTPFSVSLIYLMRVCYEDVSLHKPHTSRPANSERYITCKNLRREYSDVVRDYLKRVNRRMEELKDRNDPDDVEEILPVDLMKDDLPFLDCIVTHNHRLAQRQTVYLNKYLSYSRNQGLFDKDQGNLRDDCLSYWMIPNKQRQRDREGTKQSLNAAYVMGIYAKKMLGDRDYALRPPVFVPSMFEPEIPLNFRTHEYRFVRLAEKTSSSILVAATDAVYINVNGQWEPMDRDTARIPENTILLVEKTQEYVRNGKKIEKKGGCGVIRIIDAAVLNGDDVSELPYEQRMQAASKFCQALRLVKREIKIGWDNKNRDQKGKKFGGSTTERIVRPHVLVTAQIYTLNQIDELKENVEQTSIQNETSLFFTESDFLMTCSGIRFTRILKEEWKMGWSKSQRCAYAYSPAHRHVGSVFENDFMQHGCQATFWDSSTMKEAEHKKLKAKINDNVPIEMPQCVWKWENNYNNGYGPRVIMNDSQHGGGPTLASIQEQVHNVNMSVGRNQ